MLRIALKCHHTQSPHRLSHGVPSKPGPPMFLMPSAGVSIGSHQALTGSTGSRLTRAG